MERISNSSGCLQTSIYIYMYVCEYELCAHVSISIYLSIYSICILCILCIILYYYVIYTHIYAYIIIYIKHHKTICIHISMHIIMLIQNYIMYVYAYIYKYVCNNLQQSPEFLRHLIWPWKQRFVGRRRSLCDCLGSPPSVDSCKRRCASTPGFPIFWHF